MKIMTALTTAGTSTEFRNIIGTEPNRVFFSGVFDTANIQLQVRDPDGNWLPIEGETDITAPVMKFLDNRFPNVFRYELTSPGATTSITISVEGKIVTA